MEAVDGEARPEERFAKAQVEGDLPQDVDPADLARYLATVLTGLGVQAANGVSQAEMIAPRGDAWTIFLAPAGASRCILD